MTFKRTGAWGKSWSHQIYVFDSNLSTKHSTKTVDQTLDQFFPHYNYWSNKFDKLQIRPLQVLQKKPVMGSKVLIKESLKRQVLNSWSFFDAHMPVLSGLDSIKTFSE